MTDREKAIKGLEKIAEFFKARGDMAVGDGKMLLLSWMRAAEDAIALLEAQEPIDGDTISRSALLAAYDAAHKGPPGGARKLIEEAHAVVLKAQEPRVLSAADVAACPKGTVLWVEERQGVTWNMFPLEVETSSTHPDTGTDYLFFITYHDIRKFECSEYNQTWRCWTSRPTDEQREATPWPK